MAFRSGFGLGLSGLVGVVLALSCSDDPAAVPGERSQGGEASGGDGGSAEAGKGQGGSGVGVAGGEQTEMGGAAGRSGSGGVPAGGAAADAGASGSGAVSGHAGEGVESGGAGAGSGGSGGALGGAGGEGGEGGEGSACPAGKRFDPYTNGCVVTRCVTTVAVGDAVIGKLAEAVAGGCDVEFAAGTHTVNARLAGKFSGTADSPLEIRSAPGGERARLVQENSANNVLEINESSHLTIHHLDISGGDRGLLFRASADHVRVDQCVIHDTLNMALAVNVAGSSYDDFTISNTELFDVAAGPAAYFGCGEEACTLSGLTFTHNYVHDVGTTILGRGVYVRRGSRDTVISHNVIHETQAAGITLRGAASDAPALIEGNLVYAATDAGIELTAHTAVRNNIVLGGSDYAIAQTMMDLDAGWADDFQLKIENNTILTPGIAVRISHANGATVVNNALYTSGVALRVMGGAVGLTASHNVGVGTVTAGLEAALAAGDPDADFIDADLSGAPPMNPFPKPGSALIGSALGANLPSNDFNGTARGASLDVGAYRYSATGNPSPALAEGFKPQAE